jgi:hypothetical protein
MVYPARRTGNSKFGAMFLWAGCICQVLWLCASISLRPELGQGDFAPIFIYSALALAGLSLTMPGAGPHPARAGHDAWFRGLTDTMPSTRAGSEATVSAVTSLRAHVNADLPVTKPCRVMAIGPAAIVQTVLGHLLQSPALIVEHAETAGIALQRMAALPRSDLPEVLIMPWLLPVVRSPDFVRAIKLDRRLGSIRIIVWGPGMPASLIRLLYKAGATCVIPSQLDEVTSEALHQFCITVGAQHTESGA